MTVYVDALRQYRADLVDHETRRAGARHGHRWAHMLAMPDDVEALHALARRIGLRREWFQDAGTPHYDVTPTRRRAAIQAGAVEADRRTVVEIVCAWRKRHGNSDETR